MSDSVETVQLAGTLAWLNDRTNYESVSAFPKDWRQNDPARHLRHVRAATQLMDDPQLRYPTIHITGTNGKTSVTRMTTALFMAQGLHAGSFTSPHLEQLNERICIDNVPLSNEDLIEALMSVQRVEPFIDEPITYFEILTIAAFRHFADNVVDVGVVEVGIGGLFDSTNIIDASVAVVTNVALDHQAILGSTREDIAVQKAGIVKPNSTLVLGENDPSLLPTFLDRNPTAHIIAERDFGCLRNELAVGGRLLDLKTPRSRYDDVFLSIHGIYQGGNAAIALAAVEEFFDKPLDDAVVREAFGTVRSPGRVEVIHRSPLCVVDGAHNAAGARALMGTIDEEFGSTTGRVYVIGMLSPHDPHEMFAALKIQNARLVIACRAPSPRAISADQIAAAAREAGVPAVVIEEVDAAVHEALATVAKDELVLITGSLYVAGAARAALRSPSA